MSRRNRPSSRRGTWSVTTRPRAHSPSAQGHHVPPIGAARQSPATVATARRRLRPLAAAHQFAPKRTDSCGSLRALANARRFARVRICITSCHSNCYAFCIAQGRVFGAGLRQTWLRTARLAFRPRRALRRPQHPAATWSPRSVVRSLFFCCQTTSARGGGAALPLPPPVPFARANSALGAPRLDWFRRQRVAGPTDTGRTSFFIFPREIAIRRAEVRAQNVRFGERSSMGGEWPGLDECATVCSQAVGFLHCSHGPGGTVAPMSGTRHPPSSADENMVILVVFGARSAWPCRRTWDGNSSPFRNGFRREGAAFCRAPRKEDEGNPFGLSSLPDDGAQAEGPPVAEAAF
jgi:hypothetical protein